MTLFKEFAKQIPSVENICIAAAKAVSANHAGSTAALRKHFSAILEETEDVAYKLYLQKELEAGENVLSVFLNMRGVKPVFKDLNSFFLSLSQSRKTRAGKTFETTIRELFKQCGYPFEEQCVINGKPDFLMPSKEHYLKNAPDCIIFTAKRTVRERWRQIATEGVKGKGLFLATQDDKVTANGAKEMLDNRIYLVVPKSLKNSKQIYGEAPNIISFEDFLTDHLNPAMARWRRAKII